MRIGAGDLLHSFRRPQSVRILLAAALAGLAAACGGGGSSTGGGGTVVVAAATAPGAPTGVTATAGNASASIAFTAPASNGGAAITSYTATCVSGALTQSASAGASPIAVTGLTNGLAYSCTVTAANSVGAGPASAAASVTPTTGAPGAPTLQSAGAFNASALLTFAAGSPGSSPITGYTATCTAGASSIVRAGAASPILVLGLTNGTAYSCTVAAANAQGAGPSSAALSVTPSPSTATPAGVASATTIDFSAVVSYVSTLPAYYDNTVTPLDNTPAGTTPSDRVATLGRVLFYDRKLSVNDTVSCASCHQQALGFSDARRFSVGFSGAAFTTAHSMRLGNIRYYQPGSMFWDRRAASVEAQASQPIQNAVEMGWDATAGGMPALIAKLDATTYYRDLFNFAFGTPAITEARIQQAIAQFERAMVSTSSRWDTGYALVFNAGGPNRNLNVDLPNFTTQENRGRQIFMTGPAQGGGGCIACHQPPTFSLAANSQSNGLDAGETRIFKSPSLKSAGSGPYMHDGRFATLEDVVTFYDSGVQAGPALDNRLRAGGGPGGGPLRLNLNAADRAALAAFLRTLDDTQLNTDPRFANAVR
jgi:cytochrome c peroxidase